MGGLEIGLSWSQADMNARHKTRDLRGKDRKERGKRTCSRCALYHGTNGTRCDGRKGGRNGGQKACEFFNAVGFPSTIEYAST